MGFKDTARAIGPESFGLVLVLGLAVVFVLAFTNQLPFLPAVDKNLQTWGSLVGIAFAVPSTLISVKLGMRARKKVAALREKDVERQALLHHEVHESYRSIEAFREQSESMIKQLEHAISQNKEILQVLRSPEAPIKTVKPQKPKLEMKMVLLGEADTGKTTLKDRWLFKSSLRKDYKATTDAECGVGHVNTTAGAVAIQVWDTAGHDKLTHKAKKYYSGSNCCGIVFDVSRHETYLKAVRWYEDFLSHGPGDDAFVAFIGNKVDLPWDPQLPSRKELEHNIDHPCFFVSTKTGLNVDHAFDMMSLGAVVKHRLVDRKQASLKKQENRRRQTMIRRETAPVMSIQYA
ncbi:ras-related protein Rab-7a [Lingula anatina]|uniref:Ras-related protein Rab-7a n=1 Tax=Lingula anatina TaxID=7574 RepID=A0A1S3K8T9_LINAN|nr:ras-related protein Rab-7a [Lingula anatina]XP_013418665.1 ras-related protein Rab-7a [Lingula anatina]XP_013418666.1 ras-related protein Rab-7a [Lingula anatina]XP_013418667.1 ras-related protein Rab-7a [Lingula anatina]|eukprot:XP_013418664.1 ras-related protein Rab-7a [Lingula anatina]